MKHLKTFIGVLIFFTIGATNLYSQTLYLSTENGPWSFSAIWLVSTDGGSTWLPAGSPPTGSEDITVVDTVEVDLSVNITGYVTTSGTGNIEITTGSLTFGNGSTYEHARNAGGIPPSTWGTGSTALFTGVTTQAPANRNQSFYNIIWNCPNQASNLNMGFDEVIIGGDITIVSTGTSNRWYLCGPVGGDSVEVTINGDIIQTGGQFSSQGTGNGLTEIKITVNGNINVTGGNFSVARGSQGNTGSTLWYLYGENFLMSDATTQNSNPDSAKFIFSGTTPQNLTLNNVTFSGGFPVEVAPNAIVYAGESEIEGSGDFILNDNATLGCGNEGGIDSTLQMGGDITLSNNADFTFNGSIPQVTGSMLPGTINELTINNGSDVTLTQDIVVNGDLTILDGDLHLDGHYIFLDYTGTLIETAGNTVTDPTGGISAIRTLNAPSGVNVGGLGLAFTSTDNWGDASVERFHSAGTGFGNEGILRQYLVSFIIDENNIHSTHNSGNQPDLASTLRFYYDESELNGIGEQNLALFNSDTGLDGSWALVGGTVNATDNYVEVTDLLNYGYFWTLADINAPIPVELLSFTAVAGKEGIVLNWRTATETNNSGWNIERKQVIGQQQQSWQQIGFVDGSGTTTSQKDYSFTDNNISSSKYQYRLKQVDFNGTSSYSNVVEVSLLPEKFAVYQNYPNPFNPSTTIKYDIPRSSVVNLTIYNTIGERVATLVNEQKEAGIYSVIFDAKNLSSGIYFCRFTAGSNVFTNKMILIK